MHKKNIVIKSPYHVHDLRWQPHYYITITQIVNSNQEHTNLILKKVILSEMGMDRMTQTSPEKIRLLWDEFQGHSVAI